MDRAQGEIEQYRKELTRDRSKVSDSVNDIIRYTSSESDPLRDGVTNGQNPFKSQRSCTIL